MPLSKVGHKMRAFKQQIKVITLKYSKNWLHFLTATTNCSKMLNHGLFISFLSLFCEIHSILNWKISIKSRLLYKISDFRCFLMCNQSARNLLIYYLSKWFCRVFMILGMYNFAAHLNSMASSNKVKMGKTFVKRFLPQQYEK